MSEPDLVLLDEPCAGVNPSSFGVIEHNRDFVMDLCHRILFFVRPAQGASNIGRLLLGGGHAAAPVASPA